MNTVNRFDQEEYARLKMQDIKRDVQAARRGRGLRSSRIAGVSATLLVLSALLLIRLPTAIEHTDAQNGAPIILQWQSPVRALPAAITLLASVRDQCVFVGAGKFEEDFTLRLLGLSPARASITACTPEMPLGSRLR